MHYGRIHSSYSDCALSAYRAENEENLNIHLSTCETFNCEDCEPGVMVKTFPEMKAHLTIIIHLKLDLTNVDKVTRRTVTLVTVNAFIYCTVSY